MSKSIVRATNGSENDPSRANQPRDDDSKHLVTPVDDRRDRSRQSPSTTVTDVCAPRNIRSYFSPAASASDTPRENAPNQMPTPPSDSIAKTPVYSSVSLLDDIDMSSHVDVPRHDALVSNGDDSTATSRHRVGSTPLSTDKLNRRDKLSSSAAPELAASRLQFTTPPNTKTADTKTANTRRSASPSPSRTTSTIPPVLVDQSEDRKVKASLRRRIQELEGMLYRAMGFYLPGDERLVFLTEKVEASIRLAQGPKDILAREQKMSKLEHDIQAKTDLFKRILLEIADARVELKVLTDNLPKDRAAMANKHDVKMGQHAERLYKIDQLDAKEERAAQRAQERQARFAAARQAAMLASSQSTYLPMLSTLQGNPLLMPGQSPLALMPPTPMRRSSSSSSSRRRRTEEEDQEEGEGESLGGADQDARDAAEDAAEGRARGEL